MLKLGGPTFPKLFSLLNKYQIKSEKLVSSEFNTAREVRNQHIIYCLGNKIMNSGISEILGANAVW